MKGNKGITLIALVITIIVLLILAAVSIAMLTGENSILKRASQSSIANSIGEAKDQVALTMNAAVADYYDVKYAGGNITGLNANDVRGDAAGTSTQLKAYVIGKIDALGTSIPKVKVEAKDSTITITSTEDRTKNATCSLDDQGKITSAGWTNNY